MSAKTRKLIAIVAGLLVLALIVWGFRIATRPAPEVFQGQMEAQETDIAGKVTARVVEVLVKEGDVVQAGTLLVRMNSPEVEAKLAQATAAEQAAKAVAEKAQHGARPQEIEMARMQWQRAETAAELARISFSRVDGLAREGLVAAQKRDEAEANWKASRDAAVAAKAQYDMARIGARNEDKAAADAQVRQVAGVVAEVEAARAETELRSPVAGEVAKVLAKAGELLPQGVAVATVVDLRDQWVVLNVREDRLDRFAIGKEFDAILPAISSADDKGGGRRKARFKVYYSAPLPDFATWRATRGGAGFDVRTFEVRARPLQPIEGARPGMSVLVE
ncbi:HlyD family efflux transporter periplasmic adaptor subunit [Variovorax sp. J2P1-59]|uniref:HlyD family secretion protein n=1 Tax=Variovorax flavidus TaxID=3053501 RepID=UPI0025750B48|nr:HlyD family efflux transporter periplasmic adaptor subunit [Variovorax sp. J2P1-59]MDM0073349.1 HlyD family efflux transporter periplasmic adaptor subunit [Variovorax sp. J2P1-59]